MPGRPACTSHRLPALPTQCQQDLEGTLGTGGVWQGQEPVTWHTHRGWAEASLLAGSVQI